MSIRVGTIKNNKKPSFDGFIPIVVMTKSSTYGELSPYCLKNEEGMIMENIWQFSKIYKNVPKTIQTYSQWDKRVIWDWQSENHVTKNEPNEKYWIWRNVGMRAEDPIRYPVGKKYRKYALGSLIEINRDENYERGTGTVRPTVYEIIDYIEARKRIYLPVYSELVKREKRYEKLAKMLKQGKNLLILEVDGPHQESLKYYFITIHTHTNITRITINTISFSTFIT